MSHYTPEYNLYRQVAYYLRMQYPKVLYRFDMAGLNLSKSQAGMNKAIQCGKGWPDLFIAKPMIMKTDNNHYHGLFIELKPEGTRLYKQNGEPATPHIAEQLNYLLELRKRGYCIAFGVGFDNVKNLIDNYLNGKL